MERLILYSPNIVNLCVDSCIAEGQYGRLYHQYRKNAGSFSSLFRAFEAMEQLYDDLQFPQASTRYRNFRKNGRNSRDRKKQQKERWEWLENDRKEIQKVETFNQVTEQRGEKATFVVRVTHRQNSSWQGEVTWVEQQRKERFRSVLELVKLMDSALHAEEENMG